MKTPNKMKAEEFIKKLIEKYDNPAFEVDADWWDWGNVDDAHGHGVEEGIQSIIDELKTFKNDE